MSDYTERVTVEPVPGGLWRLASPLIWHVGRKGSGLVITVKPGFVSDLATVPWFARALFRTADARFAKASILHDFMLADGFDGVTAAAEFRAALKADGVAGWRLFVMFAAVTWWHW